jgi:hypothetical protein
MQPLVSILIPCFNNARWVAQAIDSALAQTGPAIEVIVVDDGSTDDSLSIIKSFEGRIHWESGPNRGAPAARNRLLDLARGEWLQYLDADDYLRPGKIERQLAVANKHPDCDVVYSATACEVKREEGLVTVDEVVREPHDPWILLAHWELPQTGGSLWQKKRLQQVGGWRVDQPCCQEHELYLRLLQAGSRFEHCEGCLSVYRFWDHGGRISDRLRDETYRQRLLILDRIEAFLIETKQLSQARHQAINDTRHATARALWHSDHKWALRVAESIRSSDPDYFPRRQPHGPPLYVLMYRLLGFHAAQMLADWKRQLGIRL